MPTFSMNRGDPGRPMVHVTRTEAPGTSHVMVRTQQGFSEPQEGLRPPTEVCLRQLERLLEQFRGKPLLETLLCILLDRLQPVFNSLEDTKDFRGLATATGAQLDRLGEFYNTPRNGKSDNGFRAILLASAYIVGTRGTGNEMLQALLLLDAGFAPDQVRLIEHPPAAFIMTARVPAGRQLLGEEFGLILKRAKPAGVKFVLMFEEQGQTLFAWSGDPGAGWAEASAPQVTGGIWAEGV